MELFVLVLVVLVVGMQMMMIPDHGCHDDHGVEDDAADDNDGCDTPVTATTPGGHRAVSEPVHRSVQKIPETFTKSSNRIPTQHLQP